jgi:hypothetical protein
MTDEHPQGEALACLILGKIDAFEIGPLLDSESLDYWYRLLDCGFRPVLVGGSDKDSNAVPLGAIRTYARLLADQEWGPATWIESVRAGRTFITKGPLLALEVAGREPGDIVAVEQGGSISIRARARSATPFDHLEVLAGGTVIARGSPSGEDRSIAVEIDFPCAASTWIATRCGRQGRLLAHTNPVFVEVSGQAIRPPGETTESFFSILERTKAWVEREAVCETERQRQHLLDVLLAARHQLETRG